MAAEDEAAADAENEDEGSASGGGRKKLFLFVAIGVLAFGICGGAAAYFLGLFGSGLSSSNVEVGEPAAGQKPVVFYDLPEMTVNLTSEGRVTYLKVRIALELSSSAMVGKVEPYMPRILDAFQIYLRELRPADLEGSAGLFRLKEELLRRINTAVYPGRVEGVLFKEILVQ